MNNQITERFLYLKAGANDAARLELAPRLFNMLTVAYSKVGGLAGAGFSSVDDMLENIPFWKLVRKQNRIVAAAFYKDKRGRKRVAVCTDGTEVGKNALAMVMLEDLKRSYVEISGPSLKFLCNRAGGESALLEYVKDPKEASGILNKPVFKPDASDEKELSMFEELRPYFYKRDINGKMSVKVMLGTQDI